MTVIRPEARIPLRSRRGIVAVGQILWQHTLGEW